MQDKLFFFVNGERKRKDQRMERRPTARPERPTPIRRRMSFAEASRVAARPSLAGSHDEVQLQSGQPRDIQKATPSDLLFGRLDFNATAGKRPDPSPHYVKAGNDIVSNRSGSQFRFPTSIYTQANKTNSSVAAVEQRGQHRTFNEARVGIQHIMDVRSTPVQFPSIESAAPTRTPPSMPGTERFSAANSLDQKITEITDDFTILKGNHTIVVGTHNELFKFKNLFLSEFNGYYFYSRLDAFENKRPLRKTVSALRTTASTASATRLVPTRGVRHVRRRAIRLYVNDQCTSGNNLSLTYGLRPTSRASTTRRRPTRSSQRARLQHRYASSRAVVWSPRVGFNWNPGGSTKQQVRGGVGVFAGRAPYVWISNAYAARRRTGRSGLPDIRRLHAFRH